jgi:mono/diheme cytochrome c family protein
MQRMPRGTTALLMVLAAFAAAAEEKKSASPGIPGRESYRAYCASCHGISGKGDGPAASALKRPPTDLTTIARRNGGRFPAVRVFQNVEGSASIAAHGSREMPVWGEVFWRKGGTDQAQVKLRVHNLTNFIESLQVK